MDATNSCPYFDVAHRLEGGEQEHKAESQNDNADQPLIHGAKSIYFLVTT